ncbi:MAG: ABC transporter substrate-binding protein [Lachnospiraceae bacterium]|nr:ABC transporter substrate-binding protein [Lachnospiraceae bacterium]
MRKKFLASVLALTLAASVLTACGNAETNGAETEVEETVEEAAEEAAADTEAAEEAEATEAADAVTEDRSGNAITLPEEVNTIISMAPSTTRILIDLGLADKIVASDTNTQMSYGSELKDDVVYFDMMAPDQEQIVALKPDLVFTSGMSSKDGVDAFASVRDANICVADIPSAASLDAIEEDIIFIGKCTGTEDKAQEIVDQMKSDIEAIKTIAATIPEEEKKTVLFELFTPSADYPTIYTAGKGTYIDEMLEICGLVNIAKDEDTQWPALSEEAAVAADPQVILSADMYTPDVINVILGMAGWENVTAVKDGAVYLLNADEVNQPNQHVVDVMKEIVELIYPDYFTEEALKNAA